MGGGHYDDKNGSGNSTGGPGYQADAERIVKSSDMSRAGSNDPGKRSRTQDVVPTGGDYVNHGTACEHPKTGQAGCYLPADVRTKLVADLVRRIDDAGQRFMTACATLHVEKLLEKDEDIPWAASMLLDIATAFAASKIIDALKAFRLGHPPTGEVIQEFWSLGDIHTAQQTISIEAPAKLGVMERVKRISDATIIQGVQTATGKAKGAVGFALAKAANTPAEQKAATQDYITRLQDMGAIGFDSLCRTLPAGLSDEELVAYDEAWQPGYHLPSMYLQAVSEKVNAFRASGVMQIGRNLTERVPTDEDGNPLSGGPFANEAVRRDVRVSWFHYVSGWPKQLVFEHQDGYRSINGFRPDDPGQKNAPVTRAFGPPGRHVDDEPQNGVDNLRQGKFVVDPEFWDVAIDKHRLAWGKEPEHIMIDESAWDWEPVRQRAARAQKAARAGVPKLQLGRAPQPATQAQSTAAAQSAHSAAQQLPHEIQVLLPGGQDPLP